MYGSSYGGGADYSGGHGGGAMGGGFGGAMGALGGGGAMMGGYAATRPPIDPSATRAAWSCDLLGVCLSYGLRRHVNLKEEESLSRSSGTITAAATTAARPSTRACTSSWRSDSSARRRP